MKLNFKKQLATTDNEIKALSEKYANTVDWKLGSEFYSSHEMWTKAKEAFEAGYMAATEGGAMKEYIQPVTKTIDKRDINQNKIGMTNNEILAQVDANLHEMIDAVSSIKNVPNKEVLDEIGAHLERAHGLIHNNIDFENLDASSQKENH